MARKGTNSQDYRSEAERIGPRSDTTSIPEETVSHVSDHVLREVIRKRLVIEPELATSEVHVEVGGGTVILSGSTDTLNTKYRIEELVKRVDGVKRLRTISASELESPLRSSHAIPTPRDCVSRRHDVFVKDLLPCGAMPTLTSQGVAYS
jgi:hypothetical protein